MRRMLHPAGGLFLLLAGLIAGCGFSQPSVAYVGVVLDPDAEDQWNGIQIAAESFESDRMRAVFLRADVSDDPAAIAAEAERLRLVNKAVAIIGGRTTKEAEALARCELPVISFSTTFSRVTHRRPFCVGLDPEQQAKALVKFISDADGDKGRVLILCDRRKPRHLKVADSFVKLASSEASNQPARTHSVHHFTSQDDLAKLVENIDLADFRWCLVAADSKVLTQFEKRRRVSSPILFAGDPFDVPAKPAVPIVYATVWDACLEVDTNAEFVKKYEERFRRKPTLNSALAYDAAMIVEQALERSTRPVATMLFDTFRKETAFRISTGEAAFDDRRILQRPIFLLRADPDGRRSVVKK